MYIRVIGKDMEYFKQREVILFGCGSCGQRALEEFEKAGAHILGFCDNSPKLEGQEVNGHPVFLPDRLSRYPRADIIITSTYEQEIEEQLKKMNRSNYYRIKLGVLKETIPREQFRNPVLSEDSANQLIYDALAGSSPFFAGRLGSVELECLSHFLYFLDRKGFGKEPYPSNVKMMMNMNAGFFPVQDDLLDQFCRLYINDLQRVDLIWSMWFSKYEDMIYWEYAKNKQVTSYDGTALPLIFTKPWTQALKGKKVLVIHPFDQSIRKNYKIKDKLFTNPDFLPDFELMTLKAVQSIAGNKTLYADWFEALKSMEQEMDQMDYDIALIGAGAYGLPLAAHAKVMGKKALHVGGYLQLYFGIKGRAWDKLGIYNEFWTNPKVEETPKDYKKVEAGRYW